MRAAILGPMMYPIPRSSGDISALTLAPLKGAPKTFSGVSFHRRAARLRTL